MANKLFNIARMTTATTGTGTITLGSAVSGYLSFSAAGVSDGDVLSYGIQDGNNSEVGTGTYTASGTTLSRTVTTSTNSNTAISLSGTAQVFVTARAQDFLVITTATNSLGSDTAISNSIYTDGPSMAQGTSGTWFASGQILALDTAASVRINAKLWDGTTVIDSCQGFTTGANNPVAIPLSGVIVSPAANIRISCTSNAAGATSTFKFNLSGNSKDCTITGIRIA